MPNSRRALANCARFSPFARKSSLRLYLINRWLLLETELDRGYNALLIGKASTYHGIGRDGALKVQAGAMGHLLSNAAFCAVLNARGGERKRRQARKGAQAWGVFAVAEDGEAASSVLFPLTCSFSRICWSLLPAVKWLSPLGPQLLESGFCIAEYPALGMETARTVCGRSF